MTYRPTICIIKFIFFSLSIIYVLTECNPIEWNQNRTVVCSSFYSFFVVAVKIDYSIALAIRKDICRCMCHHCHRRTLPLVGFRKTPHTTSNGSIRPKSTSIHLRDAGTSYRLPASTDWVRVCVFSAVYLMLILSYNERTTEHWLKYIKKFNLAMCFAMMSANDANLIVFREMWSNSKKKLADKCAMWLLVVLLLDVWSVLLYFRNYIFGRSS